MIHPYNHNTSREQKTSSQIPSHCIYTFRTRHSQNKSNQIISPPIAESFHIKQPPRKIISWISLIEAALTHPTASPKPLQPISLAKGIGGAHSSKIEVSQKIPWGGLHKSRTQFSCHYFLLQCEEISLSQPGNNYSSTELSSPPYWMYMCPSRCTFRATRP